MDPRESVKGKVVLVTGATGGLGKVVVRRLLEADAVVAAAYRDEAGFRALEASVGGLREFLQGFRTDVTVEAEVQSLVADAVARYGRIDALLNLAGAYCGGSEVAGTSESDWDFLIRTNLKSAFLCCRAVLPVMTAAASGRIVCVAARPAVEKKGRARSGAYAVSKAGLVILTETIAEEARRFGITANCIVPGTIDTPKNRSEIPGGDASKWADPREIADVLLFLVSDASAVISGAAIPVYGAS